MICPSSGNASQVKMRLDGKWRLSRPCRLRAAASLLLSAVGGMTAICVLMVFLAGSARADSLWSEMSINLFSNHKAMHVGDILTVIIVEDASASNQTQVKLTKESKTDLAGQGSGKLDFIPLLGGKMTYKKEHQGKGQTTLSGKMNARLTVTVVEIRPNGNLVIEGSRKVRINEDVDEITVQGVIRPEDIAADNTVLSTYISEGQIGYAGSGPGKHAGRQGIILRFLDLIF